MADLTKLYSDKVMEHFQHPRNVGELPDANGIATVGNKICGDVMKMFLKIGKKEGQEVIEDAKFQTLGCLSYQEEVVLPEGKWLSIGEVTSGMKVLNGEAKETLSSSLFTNQYTGKVLTIVPFVSPFNSFTVTPNHPVFCVKRQSLKKVKKTCSKSGWLTILDKKELISTTPEYVRADHLQEGDYLIFPRNKKITSNAFFTESFMKLLGYYLSEGYITGGDVINFSFNKNETRLINEVESLIVKILGKSPSKRTRGNVTEIRVCSKKWVDIIYKHCGKMASKKLLSQTVINLPFKIQWEMIKTYLEGDGDSYKRRPNNYETFRATTTSKHLAVQLQEIMARGGVFVSIRKTFKTGCMIDKRLLKDSIQYLISFKLKKDHYFVHRNTNYFLVPIKKVLEQRHDGLTYNFQVLGEPNSYLIKGFTVHNCGAAIATSSIATEMIKGKPLEDALKLTNQAIANALDGLPKNKIHCSVLAAEAVKKAIADYESKKSVQK